MRTLRRTTYTQAAAKARRSIDRAFSLVEVLLAIFILGVGVISIAALFPAGIAQQRLSVDEILGPTVANNALAVLRSKLSPDDFGILSAPPVGGGVPGDTLWLRPAFYGIAPAVSAAESGINIFLDADTDTEIDYNTFKYSAAPDIRISQGERYYPMAPLKDPANPADGFADGIDTKPQYVWDCMFRRFQGKVLVAIYVYRVNIPGGGSAAYHSPASLPVDIGFTGGPGLTGWAAGEGSMEDPIVGTTVAGKYNPDNINEAWEEPRQWLLDHHNNIHRVLSNYRANDGRLMVELVRPVPQMPTIPSYVSANSVKRIWYMPLSLDSNGDDVPDLNITPVYLTVKEL